MADSNFVLPSMEKGFFEALWSEQICAAIIPKIEAKDAATRRKKLKRIKTKQQNKFEGYVKIYDMEATLKAIEEDLSKTFKVTLSLEIPKLDFIKDSNQKTITHKIDEGNENKISADKVDEEYKDIEVTTKRAEHQMSGGKENWINADENIQMTDHQMDQESESEITPDEEIEDIETTGARKRFRWTIKEDPSKDGKQKQIDRLKRVNASQAYTIDLLKEKNASLTLRNANYTHLRMLEQLGETRSSLMVDASLFSNSFHSGDAILQQQSSDILDPSTFQDLAVKILPCGTFSSIKKLSFSTKESVILKTLKPDSFGLQSLAVLSHEHRLLKFVGTHSNIVSTLGLVNSNGSFSHVMSFEIGMTLFEMTQKSISVSSLAEFKSIIEGVANGLNFLFEKGVIHNHLVPENVIVREGFSKIIGFTFACRVYSCKKNIQNVLCKFEDANHLAPELYHGSPVSFYSDVYAFGMLLMKMLEMKFAFTMNTFFRSRVDCYADSCMYTADLRPPHKFLASKTKQMLYYKI
ncbi:uncharacterized protein [Clytia hemisphaerica]|uniref:uncharacterized protein isoform X1 n=1 Tax=Clytia hemisphaerica TaxID=252671 RepID=UPI0034D64E80